MDIIRERERERERENQSSSYVFWGSKKMTFFAKNAFLYSRFACLLPFPKSFLLLQSLYSLCLLIYNINLFNEIANVIIFSIYIVNLPQIFFIFAL